MDEAAAGVANLIAMVPSIALGVAMLNTAINLLTVVVLILMVRAMAKHLRNDRKHYLTDKRINEIARKMKNLVG